MKDILQKHHNYRKVVGWLVGNKPEALYEELYRPLPYELPDAVTNFTRSNMSEYNPEHGELNVKLDVIHRGIQDVQNVIGIAKRLLPEEMAEGELWHDERFTRLVTKSALLHAAHSRHYLEQLDEAEFITDEESQLFQTLKPRSIGRQGCPFAAVYAEDKPQVIANGETADPLFRGFVIWSTELSVRAIARSVSQEKYRLSFRQKRERKRMMKFNYSPGMV